MATLPHGEEAGSTWAGWPFLTETGYCFVIEVRERMFLFFIGKTNPNDDHRP